MARWRRVASTVLVQISIPIAIYSGALLWLSARLAWDPSTYIWLRVAAAREYEAALGLLPAAAAALAALPHLAAAAVSSLPGRCTKIILLVMYILISSGVLGGAAALGAWAARQAAGWRAAAARTEHDVRELAEHGRALLDVLAKHHPLPKHISEFIDIALAAQSPIKTWFSKIAVTRATTYISAASMEALVNLPRLAYAVGGAVALLLLLLLAGAALAAALAFTEPPDKHNDSEVLDEEKPLQPLQPLQPWPAAAHLSLKRG